MMSNRRSLDELLARARAELAVNETITVYEFIDGGELPGFEIRRPANPYLGFGKSFVKLSASVARMAAQMENFADSLRKSLS
ncbi:Uncharacterised protein [Mycolicibacterium vanbaalenii]|uniref:Uncharacterized protein n=1 Tax=Mycolicibacterium vanbaalenii TaxID=110539 RepID=A0A5S9R6C6_MYCVN|nr:Uncharacterised protein [Mycolicibacterium vanbaalenii]